MRRTAFSAAAAFFALGLAAGPAAAADEAAEADVFQGVRAGFVARDDQAGNARCVAADATQLAGVAFEAATPPLAPGVYEAVLRLKLPVINHINAAPLTWSFEVRGAGEGRRDFDILLIERAGVYQDIPCRFTVRQPGRAVAALSWKRAGLKSESDGSVRLEAKDLPKAPGLGEAADAGGSGGDSAADLALEAELAAEPPLGGLKHLYMAVSGVSIRRLADAEVSRLEVDKVSYRPGETGRVSVAVRNLAAAARSLRVETVFIHDLDTVIPVDERTLDVAAGAEQAFECAGAPFAENWGYAVRCRVREGDRLVAGKQEYFTVHSNLWAVLFSGSGAAQFTAHIDREKAVRGMERNKRRYRTWVESGFWAPDEFGDFTPDTERWWGGQGCYYGSVTGTAVQIEEGHKRGIRFAVYANIWGGDGPPAFELARRRPDWGYPSTFNVEWFERWDRNPMGTGRPEVPMHVWPITIIHHGGADEPARHHGRELIGTHRMFGWDAVRYDSHAICDGNARVVGVVKEVVRAGVPSFQFGYNSSVPGRDPKLAAAFRAQCEGEGGIMEEGIRQFGGGGMSYGGGATYQKFSERLLSFKKEARESGGHFLAIGMDKCFPNDLVFQYVLWLAGNTHPCYDWPDTRVADYAQFAARFAGLLWDLRVVPVADPARWVEMDQAEATLWEWKEFVHQRDLGGGRRQIIVHLINAPLETKLFTHDDNKVPPPRRDVAVTVRLPGPGAKVRGAWFLTPEYELTQQPLKAEALPDGRVRCVAPKVRFWSTVVLDLEEAGGMQ